MLRFTIAALIAGGLSTLPAIAGDPAKAPDSATLLNLSAGDLHFTLTKQTGMQLSLRGVPVIRQSTMYIVKPGWTGAYLDLDKDVPDATSGMDGDASVGTATMDKPDAYAKYRYEIRPDNSFKVTCTFASKGPAALVEYDAGYIHANLLAGARFSADTLKGKVDGVVPLFADSADEKESKFAPDFSHITFDTVQGRVELTVEGSDDLTKTLTLFDARANTSAWAQKNPVFWLGIGVPAPSMPSGEHTVTLTWKFGEPTSKMTIPSATGTPKVVALKEAQVPFVPDTPVIPQPKEQKAGDTPFRIIPGKTVIFLSKTPSDEEKQAARELQAEFKDFWGTAIRIQKTGIPSPNTNPGPGSIIIATKAEITAVMTPEDIAHAEQVLSYADLGKHAEGYFLAADGDVTGIIGADPRGAYYGAQTLKQLIRVDAKGVYIKPVEISDWPSLSMRGVHWFGGPDAWPFHQKMIDRIISAYKMNTMVFQCDYTQWATQPKIWSSERSSTKADVKKAVDYARSHFIEPIPLVNTLGHSEWLFWNDQNLDICTDPKAKFAYDPENPHTYEVVMPIMQEAVDLFQPKYFHIGHDEVTTNGAFPKPGSKKAATDLILADINKMHDWLTAKGIKTMMWGDMLLDESEASDAGLAPSLEAAAARRAGVPKDIIIADWHYQGSDPKFPSVAVLQNAGFKVVGTTWYDWGNVQNFSRVLNQEDSMGFLQSTWAGYNMFPDIIKGDSFNQFVAYLLGAEYAWNGGKPNVADLGYSPDEAFLAAWNRRPVAMTKRGGFTVDLAPASNAGMWDWVPSTATRIPAPKTTPFPTGRVSLGGIVFQPSRPVWLAGSLNPSGAWPKSVSIPLGGKKAGELHFLWGTTFAAEKDSQVAVVKVDFADGTSDETPLKYGRQIFAFSDAQAGPETTTAWHGAAPYGGTANVRRWMWINPSPAKAIKSVTLTSAETEAAPVLLGITGIQ
jgi:hypothetical protein